MITGFVFTRSADGAVTVICDPSVPIQVQKLKFKELVVKSTLGDAAVLEFWDSSMGRVRSKKFDVPTPVSPPVFSEPKQERKRR